MEKSWKQGLLKTVDDIMHSPFALQAVSLGFFLLFLLSFRPFYALNQQGEFFGDEYFGKTKLSYRISETGFFKNTSEINISTQEIIIDEDGKEVVQVRPQARKNTTNYTVRSGDNISKIAHKFGIKISTLLWANNLTAKEDLPVGKDLRIPPTDGVYYTVKNGDTLSEIGKAHDTKIANISQYNTFRKHNLLSVGQELFIPDAKKIFVPEKTITYKPKSLGKTVPKQIGSIGQKLIRPTKGVITQGFHSRHYAIDIASKLNTPIYASAAGRVEKALSGWNYGYGKYIVVDHGNGLKTLYSHLNAHKVKTGDWVETGQLIGLMGNTGNVFGPTGIHLHFEVRINGRKVNPFNYF